MGFVYIENGSAVITQFFHQWISSRTRLPSGGLAPERFGFKQVFHFFGVSFTSHCIRADVLSVSSEGIMIF